MQIAIGFVNNYAPWYFLRKNDGMPVVLRIPAEYSAGSTIASLRFFLFDPHPLDERHLMVADLEHHMELTMIDRFELFVNPVHEFFQLLTFHVSPSWCIW